MKSFIHKSGIINVIRFDDSQGFVYDGTFSTSVTAVGEKEPIAFLQVLSTTLK